jgi:hypothetical protein
MLSRSSTFQRGRIRLFIRVRRDRCERNDSRATEIELRPFPVPPRRARSSSGSVKSLEEPVGSAVAVVRGREARACCKRVNSLDLARKAV